MKLKQYLTVLATLCIFFQTPAMAKTETKNETKKVYGIAGPKLQYHSKKTASKTYVVKGVRYRTVTSKEAKNYTKEGKATFYHSKFIGQKTSSGEVYNETLFTAAHKTLPLNSYVLVTNLRNQKKVVVRINDRGPFHSNRIIDLSQAAAKELGMTDHGITNVKLDMVIIDRNGNLSGEGVLKLASSQQNIEKKVSADSNLSTIGKIKLTASNLESREKAEQLISNIALDDVKTEIIQKGNTFNVDFGPSLDQNQINSIKLAFAHLNSENGQLYTYHD